MADPAPILERLLQDALADVLGPSFREADPVLRPSDHADYQANAAMALAKQVGRPPREIATEVAARLAGTAELASVEVAGPGFLNITLSDSFVARLAAEALADADRLGVATAPSAKTVVVDYSSPNVAKEMHVGHLRSTVIGDSIVRLLEFVGHHVVRQNHLGDWGTQFGMLIEHLVERGETGRQVSDLDELYREAKQRFDADPAFADRARARVVQLQGGDAETLALWRQLVAESERHFERVYEVLGVKLAHGDVRGESFYNDLLASTVDELEAKGLAKLDDGALCVFPPGFAGRDGEPLPLIVRKSDGGFGYAATDLAGVRFRVTELGADWIVYVVDARQSQHFSMVFATAAMAGWLGEDGAEPRAQHVAFGMVLGPDNRPFKTREGGTIRLLDLLDEAVQRAAAAVEEKNPDLSPDERADVAQVVGIGALKYADLSSDRVKDYVFEWDRMLSFDGNTAPYLQYAHARIQSILRRAEQGAEHGGAVVIGEPAERALALQLLSFGSNVAAAVEGLQPHRLCQYLFSVASAFTTFYEACPVLRAESEEVRASRLALCELTARTLRVGLGLLGIAAPDRM